MIRYYLDSQIFRYIKKESPTFNQELYDCVESMKNKVVFLYSEAHLEDLAVSTEGYRKIDLLQMGEYVNKNFISRDYVSDKTEFHMVSPVNAYEWKDYSTSVTLENPFDSTNQTFKDGDIFGGILNDLMNSLFNMEIPIGYYNNNVDTLDLMKGLGINQPIIKLKDLMGIFLKKFSNKREFVEMRKLFHKYLKNEEYSYENFGMEFDELMKKSVFGKSFFEFSEQQLAGNKKDSFFDLFKSHFINLEFFGVTTERKKNNLKEFTFNNLNVDSSHAYYASFSDYFITNDNGLRLKSMILYKYFNIPTRVLTPKELIAHGFNVQNNENISFKDFVTVLSYDLKNSVLLSSKYDFELNAQVNTFSTLHNYFNYINRIQTVNGENINTLVLYCERQSTSNRMLFVEIEMLSRKLITLFGIDDELKGVFIQKEIENFDDSSYIRKWTIENSNVILSSSKNQNGQHITIQINLN